MTKLKRIAIQNLGLTALVLALAIRFLFWVSPTFFNATYFEWLFPTIRNIQGWLHFLWIIPGYYILAISSILWFVYRFPRKGSFKQFIRRLANLLGGTAAIFLLLFGYAYLDIGYAQRNDLTTYPEKVNLTELYVESMASAVEARSKIAGLDSSISIIQIEDLPSDDEIKEWVSDVLISYPANAADFKLVHFKPEGILRRLAISGIYNPFTGEANVDAALPNLQFIFVAAHELAHAHGIASEAEANFVAYLSCKQSGNQLAVYSAEYMLWRQIAQEVNKTFPREITKQLAEQIPTVLRNDRQALIEAYYKHKAYFPAISEGLNNTYLKVQGIEAGADDYDGFLKIYLAWKEKYLSKTETLLQKNG